MSAIKAWSDNPDVTAYVLGELPPDEMRAFESVMATNAELRAEVERMQGAAADVRSALHSETLPALSDAMQTAILAPRGTASDASASSNDVAAPSIVDATSSLESVARHSENSAEIPAVISLAAAKTAKQRRAQISWRVVGTFAAAASVALIMWGPQWWRGLQMPSMDGKERVAVQLPPVIAAYKDDDEIMAGSSAEENRPQSTVAAKPAGTQTSGAGNRLLRADESAMMDVDGSTNTTSAASVAKKMSGGVAYDDITAAPPAVRAQHGEANTETYHALEENQFAVAAREPLSTFGIDVDTASYSNVRRFLTQESQLPPRDSVRIEELLNYFSYDDAPPTDGKPFAVHLESASAPWAPTHRVVRIGLKGRVIAPAARPASNLVFLIDVSGSMDEPNKLPLVKRSLKLLVDQLTGKDHLAIVVYAGSSGMALPATSGYEKTKIFDAIDHLEAGGSTNGGEGIMRAYQLARENFVKDGVNRVILATDGDFNVGTTSEGELTRLVAAQAKSGVYLSVLGFGMGNYKDATLEQLADKGNGNYGYIDTLNEARKMFVQQINGTLVTIAKDVKLQVEFNPNTVAAYRLIGYENRVMRAEDFNNDAKDSGDMGAGHSVTALYEIVPVGEPIPSGSVDALKYQKPANAGGSSESKAHVADTSLIGDQKALPSQDGAASSTNHELLTVKLRFKQPSADVSELMSVPLTDNNATIDHASENLRFAAAVAEFGMLLKNSEFKGTASFDQIRTLASSAMTNDLNNLRKEFLTLVEQARVLSVK